MNGGTVSERRKTGNTQFAAPIGIPWCVEPDRASSDCDPGLLLENGTLDGAHRGAISKVHDRLAKYLASGRRHRYGCAHQIMMACDPFPTVNKLAEECGADWSGFRTTVGATAAAEAALKAALQPDHGGGRILDSDCCLVMFGSFARCEMMEGSDYDWAVLVDGVVNTAHSEQARAVGRAMDTAGLPSPGAAGVFGGLVFSHDLVHFIGGGADSNANLTRRMLMLLESRAVDLAPDDPSQRIWGNVVKNILKRYFEEDVHFRPGQHRVPRFLLNDITRYWRTICVDYAAKHREQGEQKWALRNAKIRLSRKLLYAAGIAFCFSCELNPPRNGAGCATPFVQAALKFAQTPPLEYLASFISQHIVDADKRKRVAGKIFGAYDRWLLLMNDTNTRGRLKKLSHAEAAGNPDFKQVRTIGSEFASGLRELFFNRDSEDDAIAKLSFDYVGF